MSLHRIIYSPIKVYTNTGYKYIYKCIFSLNKTNTFAVENHIKKGNDPPTGRSRPISQPPQKQQRKISAIRIMSQMLSLENAFAKQLHIVKPPK